MKIEKNKHDHKLTHLLKVGIFAMLMIAPLFASCSQLMYVTFNKNAYQSTQITGTEYYTTYEYETNEVNSVDDLIVGNIYHFTYDATNVSSAFNILVTTDVYNLKYGNGEYSYFHNENAFYMRVGTANNIYFDMVGGERLGEAKRNNIIDCYVIYQSNTILNKITYENFSASDYLGEKTVNERPVQALDNAFYYGVEKMTESPLFNWTQNTALYTGIKAMTDNLQVQTNVIAVLVTYWTILTIIYIIIDIVLALFTKMTHLLVRSD